MKFRKATKNDVQAIVEMIADDELGKIREDFKTPLPVEYYKAFANIVRDNNQELIVVETGLGTEMFHWAIGRAKERKAHVLQLTTDKKRPKAIAFYTKLGFKASHEGMKMHF